ncbi:MAG TPA: ABC transporter permease [Hyphomicrobiales bacterium]|nr:ABC transporter permease [Hyphomicrobiales bacterium]
MTQTDAAAPPRRTFGGSIASLRDYAIVIAFVLLLIVLTATSNHFLTWINLLNTLESGAIYGIVAVAFTVLLIVGEFDLCSGAIYVLAGIVAAELQPMLGTWPSLALGAVAGLAIGIFNGAVVAYLRINSFIATLASSLMVVGIGTKITNGFQLYIAAPDFGILGNGKVLGVDYFIWIFLAFVLASGFVLSRTKLGRWLYASGGNPEAARLSGINVRALRIGAFAFSGFAAGVAGSILISRTATAIAGDGLADVLFPAIAAVVVGGTSIQGGRGAIWRTVLGIFFLEFIRNGFNLLEVNPYYQDIIRGAIILIAVGADALSRRNQ